MASIERTAYPRFSRIFTSRELQDVYTPSVEDILFARLQIRNDANLLCFVVLLKCFQRLQYFPPLSSVPTPVVDYIRSCLHLPPDLPLGCDQSRTLYRYHSTIREHLNVKGFKGKEARHIAVRAAYRAAEVMDQQTDLINATIDELVRQKYELPAFSTVDRIVERVHAVEHRRVFGQVLKRLSPEQAKKLDNLLKSEADQKFTAFHSLKDLPKRSTVSHLETLLNHLDWLDAMGDVDLPLTEIPPAKIRAFAHEARVLDASDFKRFTPPKRYTLLLCLIQQMRVRTRDDIAEMFLKRVSTIEKRAKQELGEIQLAQRSRAEKLAIALDDVLDLIDSDISDHEAGQQLRAFLSRDGVVTKLRGDCAVVKEWDNNNYLPLLWKYYRSHRKVLFRLARVLKLESTSQDRALLDALASVLQHRRADLIPAKDIDLSFATERWRTLMCRERNGRQFLLRRQFEVCVFHHVAAELKSNDLSIPGSEAFADYRRQCLPWEECQGLLNEYCSKVGLPSTAKELTDHLRTQLIQTAEKVDRGYLKNEGAIVIDSGGVPVLKRTRARVIPKSAEALGAAVTSRMPERHLLDILANTEYWTNFTRHFAPLSGSDPKLERAVERYILTVFAIGCNLGPNQAARHMEGAVSAHMLSWVNRRHVTIEKLEAAQRDLIELYLQLDLPQVWGDGLTVAADGTQYDMYEENLLAGYHFRYRKTGAVAYRHVANNYIATFSHFIPPGIWEAVYVIEGLMKSRSSRPAESVHSDTQGQSETVFAFTYLLGIKLMPRIRNWKGLTLYRPDKETHYDHIGTLFTGAIDWELIESHWQDLMQVVLSIQAGKISSAMLLRKLGNESRKNRLYRVAREVGRVVRTIFLLDWISNLPLRRAVTETTNKIESYNGFAKWISFGGEGVIAENDPDEQQKRLRYNDLVAGAVILQNAVDITRILKQLQREGWTIRQEDLPFLNPYMTRAIKRFGDYHLNLGRAPEPWSGETVLPRKGPQYAEQCVLPFLMEA
jgi:TnpA family transposase